MARRFYLKHPDSSFAGISGLVLALILFYMVPTSMCLAVSSKVTRHASSADFQKGKIEDVVIDSQGNIRLGRTAEPVISDFEDFEGVWSINSIIVSGGTVYFGTSPNGGVYSYSLNKLKKIYPPNGGRVYPVSSGENQSTQQSSDSNDTNSSGRSPPQPDDSKAGAVKKDKYLSNEHIFAMATDVSGRLLAGISGEKCRLYRFEADKTEVIFEPNDAKYIFAIAIDDAGNIYLGTGPKGKVYRLDSLGRESAVIYQAKDKNILALTIGQDGFVYAGSDGRGLVYKINPRTNTATVLYDSDQPEVTALLLTKEGDLLAAATSAKIVQTQTKFASQLTLPGRPETEEEQEGDELLSREPGTERERSDGVQKLKVANTKESTERQPPAIPKPVRKGEKPPQASYIYRITKDGFVTDIFGENAIFFCLAEQDKKLLVGTGNNAQLFTVDPATEQQAVIYEDQQATQITAVSVVGQDVYVGTANPAKLIKLGARFANKGTYSSDPVDAGQPANWGKLQIEADIPQGCSILMACRSGNVKDVNDPSFSDWTELQQITEPVQLRCPMGRFCQYKLLLHSEDGQESPVIREVAVASSIPNLAPNVESVTVSRISTTGKEGFFKISYKAKDDNNDKLIYQIDIRKLGRTNWIKLKDELESDSFEWDGKTVEDGRYEFRVTASDQRGNTPATKLTGSRISDPVVVDNTGPVVKDYAIDKNGKKVTLKLQVSDEYSAIGNLEYTIDSNDQWLAAIPQDLVYDTTQEDFNIVIESLEPGEHIIALKISDDVGNTTYKTYEINM